MSNVLNKLVYVGTAGKFAEIKDSQVVAADGKLFESIVFVKETHEIWNRGQAYGLSVADAERIAALEEAVGEGGSVTAQIEAAIDALAGSATGSDAVENTAGEGEPSNAKPAHVTVTVTSENGEVSGVEVVTADIASAAALSAVSGRVADLESAINDETSGLAHDVAILKSGETVEGSVAYQIAQIVNENNNGSIDTLNEIASWIVNDTTGAAKMASDIAANKKAIEDEVTRATGVEDDIKEEIGTKAVAADPENNVEGAVATGMYKYIDDELAKVKAAADGGVSALNADFTGEKAVASTDGHVTVGLKEEAGIITSLTVATDDIASATLLGTADDDSTKNTAFGKIAAVQGALTAGIEALDADETSEDGTNVTVEVVEEDGVVTEVHVSESYAEVTYTASSVEGTTYTDAVFSVKSGDEGKLVTAADLKKAVDYMLDVTDWLEL